MKAYPCVKCKSKRILLNKHGSRWGVRCELCGTSTRLGGTKFSAIREWNYWNVHPDGEMVVI